MFDPEKARFCVHGERLEQACSRCTAGRIVLESFVCKNCDSRWPAHGAHSLGCPNGETCYEEASMPKSSETDPSPQASA